MEYICKKRNSPDLNPIENLWATSKEKVAYQQPSSAKELEVVIERVWAHGVPVDYCRDLVRSMPASLEEVIKGKEDIIGIDYENSVLLT